MSGQFGQYPLPGGVPVYSTFAAFPATASNGQLALAADTDFLYAYNTTSMMWVLIAGAGSIISMGVFDSGTPLPNGAHIDLDKLIMQSASTSNPGLVNIGSQTFAGNKIFTGSLTASNLTGTNSGDVTIGTANGLSLSSQVLSLALASTSTTGALSSTDWNTFNNKQSTLTLGNLTDAGTDGITVTGGTGAVVGSGTSLSQHVADTTHNGYLSSTDWNTFNGKQPAGTYVTSISIASSNGLAGTSSGSATPTLTLSTSITGVLQGNGTAISAYTGGNLTDVGTDGITITSGTGAVLGSGTSISQHVADTTHNGYLASTDWNTFNGKQAAGSYITALTGDVTASGPGSAAATLATVNSNVGSFTYASITVNAKGLVTAASSGAAPVTTLAAVGSTANANAGTISGNTLNLQPFSSAFPGVVTASGGGTTNFLRADGTWASPPGTGSTSINATAYTSTTGTANSTTPFNFDTVQFDTASDITTGSAWKFTASTAGYYSVSGYLDFSNTNAAGIILYKNGSAFQIMGVDLGVGYAIFTGTVNLALNDYIDIRTSASSKNWTGGSLNTTQACTISINKVG